MQHHNALNFKENSILKKLILLSQMTVLCFFSPGELFTEFLMDQDNVAEAVVSLLKQLKKEGLAGDYFILLLQVCCNTGIVLISQTDTFCQLYSTQSHR